jgi:hypothetical protein
MKLPLLTLVFLSLTACSSLITRKDLRSCEELCHSQGSCMSHIAKHEGAVACECTASEKIDEKAMEQEINQIEKELEESLSEPEALKIPETEQEIIPSAPEKIEPIRSQPKVAEEEVTIKAEEGELPPTPIKVETVPEVKPNQQ